MRIFTDNNILSCSSSASVFYYYENSKNDLQSTKNYEHACHVNME